MELLGSNDLQCFLGVWEKNLCKGHLYSDSQCAMANVLLLREPSQDSPDRYQAAFSAAGYHPISIPVLKTLHTNISHLRDIIQEGPKAFGYNGVVITSKRSCDSWREALQLLSDSAPDDTHAIGWCLLSCFLKVKTFKLDSQRDGVRYHSMSSGKLQLQP